MPYIDRNNGGHIVALYGCSQRPGQEYLENAELYVSPPTNQQQIADLLASAGVEQAWQLEAALAGVLSLGISQGLTEPQVYAINPGYRQIKDLSDQIKALL